MFLVSRLAAALAGEGARDLVQVPGRLYDVSGEEPRVLFESALATVSKTDQEWTYQLRIEADDDPDDNLVFGLTRALALSRTNEPGFVRFELDNPDKQRRAFVIDTARVQPKEVEAFDQLMCQGMFEFEFRESPSDGMLDQVLGYCKRTTVKVSEPEVEGIALLEFDQATTKQFLVVGNGLAVGFTNIGEGKKVKYVLQVKNDAGTSLYEEVLSKLFGVELIQASQAMVWISRRDHKVRVFQLRFGDKAMFEAFRNDFAIKSFETKKQQDAKKLQDDIEWLEGAFRDNVNMEDEGSEGEDEAVEFSMADEQGDESSEEESNSDGDDSDSNASFRGTVPPDQNSALALGLKHQRAFVTKGNSIQVSAVDHERTKGVASIAVKFPSSGEAFTPSAMMLHEGESSMLLLNPNKSDSVFRMDLSRGEVVEEWKSSHNGVAIPTRAMEHTSKLAQKSDEKMFLGVNKNSFFRMDPRVGGDSKLVGEEMKKYAKESFSCAATTGKGHLVLGSASGEVRMFNAAKKINMNAKTTLPGLGDPLIGVDVSDDGMWILGTTKTYLLVIPTAVPDGGTGFEKRMGKDKPVPRKLQMRYEDVARLNIGKVNFTPARFNLDDHTNEHRIVTSTGPFLITWNFRKVKMNKLDEYKIQRMNEKVVDGQFLFGDDKSIVVATKRDVKLRTLKRK